MSPDILEENREDCLAAVAGERLIECWPKVCRVIAAIPQAEVLEGMLASLGAKHTPEEIGIDRDELAAIFDHSPAARDRLTLMRMRRMVKG